MEMIIFLIVNAVLSLVGATGQPGGQPDQPDQFAAPPQVVATLTPSCVGDIPVPTVTAAVTNHGPGQANLVVQANSTEVGHLYLNAGQTDAIVVSSPHWEDVDNHFSISDDGEVLASLTHHFDCLHPILDVEIHQPCSAGTVDVTVTNSGAEGTQVTILLDETVVAEPPVAPGHSVDVEVEVPDVHYLRVQHLGETLASSIVECSSDEGSTPDGDDAPEPGDDPSGPSVQEGGDSGNSVQEVPEDKPGIGEDDRGRDPELTTPGSRPERDDHLAAPRPRPRPTG